MIVVGEVPDQHIPPGALRPAHDHDLLWGVKGAGTNFGVVFKVALKASLAPGYMVHDWYLPLANEKEQLTLLATFDKFLLSKLPRSHSADAYLYWHDGQMQLGISLFEVRSTGEQSQVVSPYTELSRTLFGPEKSFKSVDSIGLFDTGMYMSGQLVPLPSEKTSSFKRCGFLKDIGNNKRVRSALFMAIGRRPSQRCYLHLLHGSGVVTDMRPTETAFGCRDWDFPCVVTGVWPRNEDGDESARAAVHWVYNVVQELLPLSSATEPTSVQIRETFRWRSRPSGQTCRGSRS
jgi:hypothetical protein